MIVKYMKRSSFSLIREIQIKTKLKYLSDWQIKKNIITHCWQALVQQAFLYIANGNAN